VQLPLGVLLTAGATFQVDDNTAQRLNFRACDRNGCYANAPVTPEMLATLKSGKQLKITVPLSLNGFDDAYAKMQKPA
jgi:invasion protein IalB